MTYIRAVAQMKILSKLSDLLGGDGDRSTELNYECALCGNRTETARAACPNCGGQMEQL